MNWLSAYSSSRNSETTIVLLILGAVIGIAILVFFMVYLYRVEKNTKDMLWYLKTLTGQQTIPASAQQTNTQTCDEIFNVASADGVVSEPETENTNEQPKSEDETTDRSYIVATFAILAFLLFIGIIMAVTNS